jgi:hypothetical protein
MTVRLRNDGREGSMTATLRNWMNSMRTRLHLTAVSVSAFLLVSCEGPARSAPPVHGRVFEVTNPSSPRAAWDLVPLAGADVLVTWRKEVDVLVDSQIVCVRAVETSTAADGTFTAASWALPARMKRPETLRSTSHVIAPGFRDVSVESTSTGFATTAEHVHIVRRASDSETTSAREYLLNLKRECGDSSQGTS